jgi:hypothetical protein
VLCKEREKNNLDYFYYNFLHSFSLISPFVNVIPKSIRKKISEQEEYKENSFGKN